MYKLVAKNLDKGFLLYYKHGAGYVAMDWAASKIDEPNLLRWLNVFAQIIERLPDNYEIDLIEA